jgi:hypothetical protein
MEEEEIMKAEHSITAVALAACTLASSGVAWAAPPKPAATLDTAAIEELTGAKGSLDTKEGVFKVSLPRGDIKATAGGVRLTPPHGLTASRPGPPSPRPESTPW